MSDRVLVTGGAGFIGSHLVEKLLDSGREVLILDNFNDFYDPAVKRRNVRQSLSHAGCRLVEGDIRDGAAVEAALESFRPRTVLHLAAMAGVRPSIAEPNLYNDVNITGTTVLLEAVRKRGVDNFIFGSSSSVYGACDEVPFREEAVVNRPVSPYAATKLAGEQLCYTYHHLYGIPVTCLRFFTVYGPRQRPEMAIHLFARRILMGDPITVYGDGSSRRDYTYIDDIVDGVMKCVERPQPYEVINLGESRTVSLSEMVALLEEALERKAVVRREPDQPGDVPITFADVSKAARILDYRPRVPIEEGIGLFVQWLLSSQREA